MLEKVGRNLTLADGLLFTLILVWSVNYTVIKVALAQLHPLVFNALRFTLATLTLLAFLRRPRGSGTMSRKIVWQAALLGILANTVYQLFFIEGLARTTVAHAALIQASMPAQVALLAHITGKERLDRQAWAGLILTFGGLSLLLSLRAGPSASGPTWKGDALMFAAAFSWACYTLLAAPVLAKAPARQVTVVGFLTGTPLLVLVALPRLLQQDLRDLTASAWGGVVFSGIFAIGLGYFVWNYALRSLGTTRTAVYSNLTPVLAAVVAWLHLGERWQPLQVLGAAVALVGVTLTRFARSLGREPGDSTVSFQRRGNPPPDLLRAGRFSGGRRPDLFHLARFWRKYASRTPHPRRQENRR